VNTGRWGLVPKRTYALAVTSTPLAVSVFDCPSCGAPLPAAPDGGESKCEFCGKASTTESGGAAELAARKSREAAEALFKTLGQPPSWSQRVAVVLANPWVWTLGFPFALAALLRVAVLPVQAICSAWEKATHERLLHVASPTVGWLIDVGLVASAGLLLLVWSLLGKRVDARRELQALLASKPPSTPGGPAQCRHCNAPLVVAAGALGARCASCGADNLVMLPEAWVARAKKLGHELRLTAQLARKRDAEGRRQLRISAAWRLPMVLGLLAWISLPAISRRDVAGWSDMRLKGDGGSGVYFRIRHETGWPTATLRSIARCGTSPGEELSLDGSNWCERGGCTAVGMFALNQGETLQLEWVQPSPGVEVRLSLAPQDFLGGTGVLWTGFGDEVKTSVLAEGDPTPFAARVAISGWYKVNLTGPAEASVRPCIQQPHPPNG
jgi:hypothetical protein